MWGAIIGALVVMAAWQILAAFVGDDH